MPKRPRNLGASVRARLLNVAKQRNQQFQLLLTRFALERLLYRLSLTPHRDRFVLKGAMLVATWLDNPHRPTRDIDFLGFGDPSPEAMLNTFREICAVAVEDGIEFDTAALRVDQIREDLEYGGLRIRTIATIGGARTNVIIDVGFGDAVEPGTEETQLPALLDLPAPRLRAYARETVIAEKFQAMVMLGRANSRMKDYYDIWVLSRTHKFVDGRLARAIAATFARRQTAIPVELPDALTIAFAEDPVKLRQWDAFAIDIATLPGSLADVIDDLATFLMPHAAEARKIDPLR
jgi:predicted nucleotidyltransferase component of viral defense system